MKDKDGPYVNLKAQLFKQQNKKARRTSTDAKPVQLTTTLCKLPLIMGTKDSLDFHSKLYYMPLTDMDVFTTTTIKNYLDYKKQLAEYWYYLYMLPYAVYMILLTF